MKMSQMASLNALLKHKYLGVNPANVVAKFRALCKTIDEVRAAFKRFDVDGDGNISRRVFTQNTIIRGLSQ